MLARVKSFGLLGIEAYPVEVEVDIARGLPAVTVVGLADAAIRESRERVKSAIKNSGFAWPAERITISLAPSHVRKEGPSFDLAIAIGILAATGQLDIAKLADCAVLGELSLDGSVRQVQGALPVALAMAERKISGLLLPVPNAKEAAVVSTVNAWPVSSLRQAAEFISGQKILQPMKLDTAGLFRQDAQYTVDFSEVKGQYFAKRAIEVAISGGHNISMIGPPGSGKTMLAKRIPTVMPGLSLDEALEITKIHSVAGTLPDKDGIMTLRPFRSPHHTISNVALTGGGSIPQPGEISLAHQGVLFLDELPEFRRDCLETLRQPLEDRTIRISRIFKSLSFPASFVLVVAMNPCPCGYYTDPRKTCTCNTTKIQNYMGKVSGPLLDRIDIHIELPSIKYKELTEAKDAEASAAIRSRVENARAIQRKRFANEGIFVNAEMGTRLTRKYCALDNEAKDLLRVAMTELGLSARAYDKTLKVSRTVADLAGAENIDSTHIAEAVQYRSLGKY